MLSFVMLIVLSSVSNAAAPSGIKASSQTRVLKFQMPPTAGAPTHDVAVEFLPQYTLNRTNGKYSFEIYAGSTLSGGDQIVGTQMAQSGEIDFIISSGISLSNVVYETASISLPFIWNDTKTLYETMQLGTSVSNRLAAILEKNNFKLVGFPPLGFRDITNSKRSIRLPKDLDGLKFRVQSNDMIQELWRSWGVNTAWIDLGEVYTSLQNGTIDGQENALVLTIVPNKFYEVNKFYTAITVTNDPFIMVANLDMWNSLSPEDQVMLQECITAYQEEARRIDTEKYEACLQVLRENNVEITMLTSEETAEWRKSAWPITQKYSKIYDEELVKLVLEANGQTLD